ncbi:MAG TPA: GTP cyclohydrolase I, partial [Polyangiaceae bacterium]|nr:GTP cyclohydrolase I [Polyangiaceae bacterium]
PAVGAATVAYEPGPRILGLGTLAKLVQTYARRLSLQEQIGMDVVDTLLTYGARGAYCRLELRHSCLSARGAEQHHASVASIATGGSFAAEPGLSALALALGSEPAK